MFTLYDRNYTFYCVSNTTPFFKCFGPLLFGRPPASEAAAAFAKFSQASPNKSPKKDLKLLKLFL
jgi:hypothetical protein